MSKKQKFAVFLLSIFLIGAEGIRGINTAQAVQEFWRVEGKRFIDPTGKFSYVSGINFNISWMSLADTGNFEELRQWLIDTRNLGAKIIRIFPGDAMPNYRDIEQWGGYHPAWFSGMDFILDFAGKNGMYVQVILFQGNGGSHYAAIPYAGKLVNDVNFFTSWEVRNALKRRFSEMAWRYKDDPRIFSWVISTESQFWVDIASGTPNFSPGIYADFAADLAWHLKNVVGVKQLVTDGAMMDDIIRSGIPQWHPSFMSLVDFFVKHAYDMNWTTTNDMMRWEKELMMYAGINKPWILEEFGHKDDDNMADEGSAAYSDTANAAYHRAILESLKLNDIGVFLWGIWGPHVYAINHRFTPQTAQAVLSVFTDIPLNLRPSGIIPSSTISVTLSWDPVVGAASYGVRVQDLTSGSQPDPQSNCNEAGLSLLLCINSYPQNSVIIPIINGHSYRWWVHSVFGENQWWSSANYANFSISGTCQ